MIPLAPFVAALKSLADWLLTNLLDPRFWAVAIIIASAGYIKGCSDRAEDAQRFEDAVEAVGKQQEALSKQRNAENRAAKLEVENELQKTRKEHSDRFASLYARYDRLRNDPGRSIVPGDATSPGEPVQAGQTVCYDRDQLDAGHRAALERYRISVVGAVAGLIGVLQKGQEGFDDALWWGVWASKIGSCPVGSAVEGKK